MNLAEAMTNLAAIAINAVGRLQVLIDSGAKAVKNLPYQASTRPRCLGPLVN